MPRLAEMFRRSGAASRIPEQTLFVATSSCKLYQNISQHHGLLLYIQRRQPRGVYLRRKRQIREYGRDFLFDSRPLTFATDEDLIKHGLEKDVWYCLFTSFPF
jgi:hypothetical protein